MCLSFCELALRQIAIHPVSEFVFLQDARLSYTYLHSISDSIYSSGCCESRSTGFLVVIANRLRVNKYDEGLLPAVRFIVALARKWEHQIMRTVMRLSHSC